LNYRYLNVQFLLASKKRVKKFVRVAESITRRCHPRTLIRATGVRVGRNKILERRNLRYVTRVRGHLETKNRNLIGKVNAAIAYRSSLSFFYAVRRYRDRMKGKELTTEND
jgi:hypothetical protein